MDDLRLADAAIKDLTATLGEIERSLGLATSFLINLSREDDWTCVMKTLAIVEAALEQALIERAFAPSIYRDDHAIEGFVGRMAINGRASKIALANAVGILPSQHRSFIIALNDLRNRYAHRPGNFAKSIREMLGSSKEARAMFATLTGGLDLKREEDDGEGVRAGIVFNAAVTLWAIQGKCLETLRHASSRPTELSRRPSGTGRRRC